MTAMAWTPTPAATIVKRPVVATACFRLMSKPVTTATTSTVTNAPTPALKAAVLTTACCDSRGIGAPAILVATTATINSAFGFVPIFSSVQGFGLTYKGNKSGLNMKKYTNAYRRNDEFRKAFAEKYGIKKYETYVNFGKNVYRIRDNVRKNILKLKGKNNKIIGYGSPAKATTALNFFGISDEIDCIIEDNKLKHKKFLPGMKIPIVSKSDIKSKSNCALVLAWNFFEDIKNNNKNLADRFISIRDLQKN